jgi:hypothetical protein
MKIKSLVRFGSLVLATLSTAALAMTINFPLTLAYAREHPKEWSVDVTKGDDGLVHFTIKHDVDSPKYHVAHLAVYHQGKLVAKSDTPLFGKKRGNTFYFSLAPEDIAESKFELSDGAFAGSGEEAVPEPGSFIYQFRLLDFVPEKLLETAAGR